LSNKQYFCCVFHHSFTLLLTLKTKIMKKVFAIVAIVALVCSLASCDKKCHCKNYVGGISSAYNFEPDNGTKCSDYNTVAEVNGVKAGVECR